MQFVERSVAALPEDLDDLKAGVPIKQLIVLRWVVGAGAGYNDHIGVNPLRRLHETESSPESTDNVEIALSRNGIRNDAEQHWWHSPEQYPDALQEFRLPENSASVRNAMLRLWSVTECAGAMMALTFGALE
jgi:hypothetical protein